MPVEEPIQEQTIHEPTIPNQTVQEKTVHDSPLPAEQEKKENHVIFKGTKAGIALWLNPEASFASIRHQLEQKVTDAAKFFDGVKTPLIFRGRKISEDEERILLDIIAKKTNMHITFVQTEQDTVVPMTALLSNAFSPHNVTKFHRGAVRSGQCLEFDGSIVVIGDVNPGAIIRAEGHIIVLGQLKGTAHAGCKGMTDAFVAALSLQPVQLRISDIITRFPEETKKESRPPSYAYIENGQIYVMPLR